MPLRKSFAALAALAMWAAGCGTMTNIHRSAFLSNFVLEKSVKAVGYKGIAPGRGAGGIGGGIGGSTGRIGPGGADVHTFSTSSTSFQINQEGENKFVENEFIEALISQIKKEIEENRGSVIGNGRKASNESYVDYKDGDLKGRITISGSSSAQSYALKATVEESTKP